MKRGDKVKVYQLPMSDHECEGVAVLVRRQERLESAGEQRLGYERWTLRFEGEAAPYSRLVHPRHVVADAFHGDGMMTIRFDDDGQDFLEWDVDAEGKVVASRPGQAWLWVGTRVLTRPIPGKMIEIQNAHTGPATLRHKVQSVVPCGKAVAA
jgi:hypothetical protein